jgi:hypothetical protein
MMAMSLIPDRPEYVLEIGDLGDAGVAKEIGRNRVAGHLALSDKEFDHASFGQQAAEGHGRGFESVVVTAKRTVGANRVNEDGMFDDLAS